MRFETPLCEMAYRYGTDKCPQIWHGYTPAYYGLLRDKRESFRKVLELGIGCRETMGRRALPHYRTGASLYMWREFFPNAQVFGADILPEAMVDDDRIATFLCDTRNGEDLEALVGKVGSDIDLLVDDSDHRSWSQRFACLTLMPLLNKDVLYVIEDVNRPGWFSQVLERRKRKYGLDCQVLSGNGGRGSKRLVVVRHG